MAEDAASWHCFVTTKGIECTSKSRDIEAVSDDDNFSVEIEFGCAQATDLELIFVARCDLMI